MTAADLARLAGLAKRREWTVSDLVAYWAVKGAAAQGIVLDTKGPAQACRQCEAEYAMGTWLLDVEDITNFRITPGIRAVLDPDDSSVVAAHENLGIPLVRPLKSPFCGLCPSCYADVVNEAWRIHERLQEEMGRESAAWNEAQKLFHERELDRELKRREQAKASGLAKASNPEKEK